MSTTGEQGSTRKQRREEARARRKALESQAAQQELRRRRLIQLGAAALVVIAVVAIAFAVSSGSSGNSAAKPHSKAANEASATVDSLINGIPQSGNVLGNPHAPATLVYFGDLQCPICREFTLGAFPSVVANFVRTGKLKVEYRSMETATREPAIFREQQAAALAAGLQHKMWYFVELFYHEQGEEDSGYVTPAYLRGLAQQVPGLNLARWEAERSSPKLVEEVERNETEAGEQGFNGTPSFLLGKTGGPMRKVTELTGADLNEASALFEPEIEKALKS
ncbi:MAG TPA: thioredoxin domain-containing protein [Solirubrobacteraceae bacterium]|nr:thioredoxin domain-containing protein [Solirubrobacteraceae bacterium]